jgi:hypothetical protein
MCHIITAALPPSANLELVNLALADHAMGFRAVPSHAVLTQLPPGWHYGRLTAGMCDCGTALGVEELQQTPQVHPKLTKAKRKKGWSEERIESWLHATHPIDQPRLDEHERRVAEELADWKGILETCFSMGAADSFAILKHWYGGDPASEPISFAVKNVPRSALTTALLRSIREDVLYVFQGT